MDKLVVAEIKRENKRAARKAANKANWALRRRANQDLDGLVDKRHLVGDRVNMGGTKADQLERAEAWAALDLTFQHSITVVDSGPEQEGSALRPFAKLAEGQKEWPTHYAPAMPLQDQRMEPGILGVHRNRTVGA